MNDKKTLKIFRPTTGCTKNLSLIKSHTIDIFQRVFQKKYELVLNIASNHFEYLYLNRFVVGILSKLKSTKSTFQKFFFNLKTHFNYFFKYIFNFNS